MFQNKIFKKNKIYSNYMALDFSETNLLFITRVAIIAVIINVVGSLVIPMLPTLGMNNPITNIYDNMIHMMKHHKKKLLSSSVLVALVAAASVLLVPLLLEFVPFLA